jgi:hypothetical protein
VNHNAPSGPAARYCAPGSEVGIGKTVTAPPVVVRPMFSPRVNQSAPSGPATMPSGPPMPSGSGNWVTTPVVVMRPIVALTGSVNHSAPSGPAVMPGMIGPAEENPVTAPAVVIRPICPPISPVNHKAPSGPAVIPAGLPFAVGIANSVTTPVVVMRPIFWFAPSVNHIAPSEPAATPPAPDTGNSENTCAAVGPSDSATDPAKAIARPRCATDRTRHVDRFISSHPVLNRRRANLAINPDGNNPRFGDDHSSTGAIRPRASLVCAASRIEALAAPKPV